MSDNPLVELDRLEQRLEQLRSPRDAKAEIKWTELMRDLARSLGLNLAEQNRIAEHRLRAMRRGGQLLRESGIQKGTKSPTLGDFGLNANESSRWQSITDLDELILEQYIAEVAAAGDKELTVAGALNLTKAPPLGTDDVPDWSADEVALRERVEGGESVLLNLHTHRALEAWARAAGFFVRIDRMSPWGNPFEIDKDGTREEVVANYREFYFPNKPSLLQRLDELEGKVLACWCAPALCHGNVLLEELEQWYRDRGD